MNKLNEAEGEAAETQTWLEHAVQCSYAPVSLARTIHRQCNQILGKLVIMGNNPEVWVLKRSR